MWFENIHHERRKDVFVWCHTPILRSDPNSLYGDLVDTGEDVS